MHNTKHMKCMLWKTLWAVAGLATIFFLIASQSLTNVIFGNTADFWVILAILTGLLAIPIKLDCHDCGTCGK